MISCFQQRRNVPLDHATPLLFIKGGDIQWDLIARRGIDSLDGQHVFGFIFAGCQLAQPARPFVFIIEIPADVSGPEVSGHWRFGADDGAVQAGRGSLRPGRPAAQAVAENRITDRKIHSGDQMEKNDAGDRRGHSHRGKFTEGLLDNDLILQALDIRAGQVILDAGCGNGYMSKLFSDKVTASGRVIALDPDKQFLAVLARETKGTNIVTLAGDITRPTILQPSSIDLIYISTVIHGFSKNELQGFFQESKRLLNPDSIMAIVEIEKKETPFGPPLSSRYSPEELIGMVPMAPLNTVQVGDHFYMQLFRTAD